MNDYKSDTMPLSPLQMIYLIGIRHEFQHNGCGSVEENSRENFISYLENMIKEHKASLIAEEFSEEALQKSNATISAAKCVANKLNIKHLFCDPNTKEREIIGIPSCDEIKKGLAFTKPYLNHGEVKILDAEKKKYFPQRENFWFEKIEKHLNEVIIFLCGSDHIKSFESLLIDRGYTPEILVTPNINVPASRAKSLDSREGGAEGPPSS